MKTAGTSFMFYVKQNLGRDRVFPASEDPLEARFMLDQLRAIPAERHRRLLAYTGHFPAFAADIVGASRTITLLRDPVERTLSHIKQHQRLRPGCSGLTLEQMYDRVEDFTAYYDNHQTKIFSMSAADAPTSFIDTIKIDRARLDAAKERLASMDLVGLQEDFDGAIRAARAMFGWEPPAGSWRAWPGHEAEVPDSLRERIAADNAWDLELYEFAVGLVAARAAAA
jgi:hypothetical protein